MSCALPGRLPGDVVVATCHACQRKAIAVALFMWLVIGVRFLVALCCAPLGIDEHTCVFPLTKRSAWMTHKRSAEVPHMVFLLVSFIGVALLRSVALPVSRGSH